MALNRLPIPAHMACEYNGVVFGPTADTTAFSVRPNLDPARRTVVSATYILTVKETIADVTPVDPIVLDKIAKLSRNGGRLKYKGRGFGDMDINIAGGLVGGLGRRDVAWGPITRDVSCKCLGGGLAVELTWTVEWTTVNCPDGLTKAGTILWFNFTVSYDIDKEGYSTRHYEGTLAIAQTRRKVDDKSLQATADEHREKIVPRMLPGFRRESQSFRIEASKCEIRATVRDTQMPGNLPPVRVVDGSIEHTWQSMELFKWSGSISATYDIARREGTAVSAVVPFLDLVKGRIDEARRMMINAEDVAGIPAGRRRGDRVVIYLRGASAAEPNILGRLQVRLGVQYVAAGCSFSEILRSGGLWKPTEAAVDPEGHWKKWIASIPTVHSARGHAALVFTAKEDSLVDACVPGASPSTPTTAPAQQSIQVVKAQSFASAILEAFPAPTPANSWITYRNFVTIRPDMGRVVGRTLPTQPLTMPIRSQGSAWDVMRDLPDGPAAQSSPFPPAGDLLSGQSRSGGETFVHQRTRPALYVTISGQALRGGWNIPVPELLSVNGSRPVLIGRPMFRTGIVAHAQVPIVYADWEMTYLYTDDGGIPKRAIEPPVNPFLA